MNKLIFKKFLVDYSIFLLIAIISASLIVWIFQAVNFLDIMIDDGRNYITYIKYSLLNLPKIISRLFPFVVFFSFFYVFIRYENDNELIIFWNFGINKIQFVYFIFFISIVITCTQIILLSYIVPNSLQYSRNLMTNSNTNLFDGFIKPKKFNDTINGLTIYTEDMKKKGNFSNVYIKKNMENNSFQITYAKEGILKVGSNNVLELYDGETINIINGKLSKFKFEKSDFGLNNLETNIVEVYKIQETRSLILFSCLNKIFKKDLKYLNNVNISQSAHNCSEANLINIYKELYKRYIIPLYIPLLILITLILTFSSKEKKNFSKLKIFIFLFNFSLIVFSEISLKFLSSSLIENFLIFLIPVVMIIVLFFNYIYQFKLKF